MDSNEDVWSCFLILWDPGNPPSFCKHVSSSLRSLSSSSRRSLSSCESMSETGDSTKSCDHAREHSASFMHANNHIPYTLMCTSLEAPLWLKYHAWFYTILHRQHAPWNLQSWLLRLENSKPTPVLRLWFQLFVCGELAWHLFHPHVVVGQMGHDQDTYNSFWSNHVIPAWT